MASTLVTLEEGARQLADMKNSPFVDTATMNIFVNEAGRELHGIIATAYPDAFYTTTTLTLVAADKGVKALPVDFMRIKGLTLDAGTSSRQTIHRYNWGARNVVGGGPFSSGVSKKFYRVVSRAKIIIQPEEQAAGTYRLEYTARYTELTGSASLQDELEPWAEYIHIVAAIKALDKEESDTAALVARRDLMRADIIGSAPTDENEADTIVDVED